MYFQNIENKIWLHFDFKNPGLEQFEGEFDDKGNRANSMIQSK